MNNKLKNLRLTEDISQKELAEKIGVSESSISNWESGKRVPESRNMMKYYKVFNLPSDYFTEDSDTDDDSDKCIDISKLNHKGVKKLYECYRELIKNKEYLKKS